MRKSVLQVLFQNPSAPTLPHRHALPTWHLQVPSKIPQPRPLPHRHALPTWHLQASKIPQPRPLPHRHALPTWHLQVLFQNPSAPTSPRPPRTPYMAHPHPPGSHRILVPVKGISSGAGGKTDKGKKQALIKQV